MSLNRSTLNRLGTSNQLDVITEDDSGIGNRSVMNALNYSVMKSSPNGPKSKFGNQFMHRSPTYEANKHFNSSFINKNTSLRNLDPQGSIGRNKLSKRSFINQVLLSNEKKNWKYTGFAEMISKFYDVILQTEKINKRRRWRLLKVKNPNEDYNSAGDRKDGNLTEFYGNYNFKHQIKYNWLDIFVWDRLIEEMDLKINKKNGDSTLVIDNYHGILQEILSDEMHYALNEKPFYFKIFFRNPHGSNYGDNDLKIDTQKLRKLNFYLKVNFINQSKVQNDKLSIGELIDCKMLETRQLENNQMQEHDTVKYIDLKNAANFLFLQFIHNMTVPKFNHVFMGKNSEYKSNQLTAQFIYSKKSLYRPLRINTDIQTSNILSSVGKNLTYPILIHKKRFTGYPPQM